MRGMGQVLNDGTQPVERLVDRSWMTAESSRTRRFYQLLRSLDDANAVQLAVELLATGDRRLHLEVRFAGEPRVALQVTTVDESRKSGPTSVVPGLIDRAIRLQKTLTMRVSVAGSQRDATVLFEGRAGLVGVLYIEGTLSAVEQERAALLVYQVLGQPWLIADDDSRSLPDRTRMFELVAVREALRRHGGDATAAAEKLGVDRSTVYRILRRKK